MMNGDDTCSRKTTATNAGGACRQHADELNDEIDGVCAGVVVCGGGVLFLAASHVCGGVIPFTHHVLYGYGSNIDTVDRERTKSRSSGCVRTSQVTSKEDPTRMAPAATTTTTTALDFELHFILYHHRLLQIK